MRSAIQSIMLIACGCLQLAIFVTELSGFGADDRFAYQPDRAEYAHVTRSDANTQS